MMESVSTLCLIELALDLCSEWKKLGYVLGLEYRDADRIFQDYRKNGVAEQAYRMLREWQAKNGSKATYEVLGNALRGAPVVRVDLAEKYCDGGFRDTSNERTGTCTRFAREIYDDLGPVALGLVSANLPNRCSGLLQIAISLVPLTLQLSFLAKCFLFNISLITTTLGKSRDQNSKCLKTQQVKYVFHKF